MHKHAPGARPTHDPSDRNENLEHALNSMEQARESSADIVVFPKLAVDQSFPQHEEWNAREIAEPIAGIIPSRRYSCTLDKHKQLVQHRVVPRGSLHSMRFYAPKLGG
jgi:hypothetical protein